MQPGGARRRYQTAERIAFLRPFDHVACGRLEYMKNPVQVRVVEIAPVLLCPFDEGLQAAGSDSGVGETAVDATVPGECRVEGI